MHNYAHSWRVKYCKPSVSSINRNAVTVIQNDMQRRRDEIKEEKGSSHTFLMRNISHLLMFSRWCALWKFNGVLMANARVYSGWKGTEKGGAAEKEEKEREQTKKGSRRRSPRDGPHVSLSRSSECIYSTVDFKFLPRTIFYARETRRVIARQSSRSLVNQLLSPWLVHISAYNPNIS